MGEGGAMRGQPRSKIPHQNCQTQLTTNVIAKLDLILLQGSCFFVLLLSKQASKAFCVTSSFPSSMHGSQLEQGSSAGFLVLHFLSRKQRRG